MMMEESRPLCWRQAEFGDLPAIDRVSRAIHVDLLERPEVLAEKLSLFARGCLILCEAGVIVGYGLSHPWRLYSIPPLDTLLGRLPSSPDCIFIHDVAVLTSARGRGSAAQFLRKTFNLAWEQGISALALVSVYNTYPLWAQHGFEIITDFRVDEKLTSYGSSARYMIRKVD
jgi:hypothetical protein